MRTSTDDSDDPAQRVAGRRSLRPLAQTVFDRILAGERATRAIGHPLDFICIPLVRRPRFGLCGHIWTTHRKLLPDSAALTLVALFMDVIDGE